MKKIIILILLVLVSVFSAFSVYSADFYSTFDFSYSAAAPASVYVTGGECTDASCSALGQGVEIYSGSAITCWDTYGKAGDSAGFNSCMQSYRVTNGIVNTNSVIVKQTIPSTFGYDMYFSTQGDTYLPNFFRMTSYQCNYGVCFDENAKSVSFEKKANAIAEVGQLDIKNIDNPKKPVQVEIPVSISQSVCSAFRFSQPGMYMPPVPAGYSDYSANTLVSLNITDANTGTKYLSQAITIPIEADTCAGLAAFSWTPDSSIANHKVNFRVDTKVIDNQVSSTIPDWAQVSETMYPTNLDGACWTRAYDFTLSNVASTKLNTSVAQISQGESLYALFNAGAWRDNSVTPMNFEARILFNGTIIYDQLLNSGADLKSYSLDMSPQIANLAPGKYNVTLITQPVGLGCSISEPVEQTQNLQILVPAHFNVNFHVRDPNFAPLQGANINLMLVHADDYYQTPPTYNQNTITDGNGNSVFTQVIAGDYKYTVSKNGYTSVTNSVHIGSNSDVYITLPQGNVPPTIDLPATLTAYYKDPITFDIRNYVNDFNDGFNNLTITYKRISGNIVINYNKPVFTLSTNQPNTGVVRVFVQDPSGDIAYDDVTVNFLNNQAPVVNQFVAQPDNGEEPFNTNFGINVTDTDNDPLTCSLDFGDGTSTNGNCNTLDNIAHTYTLPGTYDAKLTANDGFNTPVLATEQVFVFNRTIESPVINSFTLTSSNGLIVPTNLTLNWDVTHSGNYSMTCTLRVNGNNTNVPCIGSQSINNFNITGISRFHIIAIDNASTQVIRTIEREFYTSKVKLNSVNTKLVVPDVITPGEFTFNIETTNESVAKRIINVKPVITCNGVANTLNNVNGFLDTSAVSKRDGEVSNFQFVTDTNNYKLTVPTDVACTFSTELNDNVGSLLTLSKSVTFQYPIPTVKLQSIRGEGTDIADFMNTALSSSITKGYNSIEFKAVNNQFIGKDLVISMTSPELNLNVIQDVNLGPGETKVVNVPLYIDNGVSQGSYPVRLSVYDGDTKQVRYSYILINS